MRPFLAVKSCSLVSPANELAWDTAVPAVMKRRDARIWQMAYVAAQRALSSLQPTERQPKSIIVGTALGALEETRLFLEGVFTDGLGSPRNFIASVYNSIAGKLAAELQIKGPNLTFCDGHNSLASSLVGASLLNPEDFPVLLVIVDERLPLLDQMQPHLPKRYHPYLVVNWEEAAVAFVLDCATPTDPIRIRSFGPTPTGRRDQEIVCQELIATHLPDFHGKKICKGSSTSFVAPAISTYTSCKETTGHTIIGSYSPTSGAVGLVEILQTP